jgi:hypothetical protein
MSSTALPSLFGPGPRRNAAGPSLALRIETFARRWSLDHRLALGERPDNEPALALRARQLVGAKTRRTLARGLRRSVRLAQEPPRWGAAAPLDRRAVHDARRLLIELALRLTDPDPVGARGVALISDLLADGGSPLYAPGWTLERSGNELSSRLRSASLALEHCHTIDTPDAGISTSP